MKIWRLIAIFLLAFFWVKCQSPGVKVRSLNELPERLHEGWNPQRWYFYNSELDTPLSIVKEKNINGLATPVIFNLSHRLILATQNGFLISAGLQLSDIDRKRLASGISAAPCFSRPLVYIVSETGSHGLLAYDLLQKKVQWKLNGNHSKSSPLVSQEMVIHATTKGEILALNRLNGETIWTNHFPQKILQNLAMTKQTILVCSEEGLISAIDFDTGQEKFTLELPEHVYTSPMLLNGHIFIADLGGNIVKISFDSGKVIKQKALKTPFYQPFSTDGQSLYIMGSNGQLFALSPNFELKWSLRLKGVPTMPVIVTQNHLIVATHQKKFYLINRWTKKIDQQFNLKRRVVSCTPAPENQLYIGLEYDRLGWLSLKQEKE